MKKYFLYALGILGIFLPVFSAKAFCPICTVAVAGGVGLSRWLGVDDTITGLWIGALLVAMTIWTLEWFKKKNIRFWGEKTITTVAYYAMVALPLYWSDIVGHPLNRIWGMDKLMVGIVIGSIFFLIGGTVHFRMKDKHGKVFFPFQKVVFAVIPLIVLSGVFYFITK